jgi:hypothetical protein
MKFQGKEVKKIRVNIDMQEDLWLKNTREVADLREEVSKANGRRCEMTGEPLKRAALDHCHRTGVVRGVISQHNNVLEGYILKYFQKYVAKHTNLNLPQWLRKLADYLELDFERKLHFRNIHDMNMKLSSCLKPDICEMLDYDFGIKKQTNECSKQELIEIYMNCYVDMLERHYLAMLKHNKLKRESTDVS